MMSCLSHRHTPAVQFTATRAERDQAASITHNPGQSNEIPDTRLMGKTTFDADNNCNTHKMTSIVWDTPSNHFIWRMDHFYSTCGVYWDGNKSYERQLSHNMVLGGDFPSGVIVDQKNGRLVFPDGRWMAGATGEMYTAQDAKVSDLVGTVKSC